MANGTNAFLRQPPSCPLPSLSVTFDTFVLLLFLCARGQTPWLDDKHVVFGEVIDGARTVKDLELLGSNSGKTSKTVRAPSAVLGFCVLMLVYLAVAMVHGTGRHATRASFYWFGLNVSGRGGYAFGSAVLCLHLADEAAFKV